MVERKDDDSLSINFLAKSGANFVWPTIPDVQTVKQKDVMMQIETPPFLVSSRHFGMDNQTVCKIEALYNKLK